MGQGQSSGDNLVRLDVDQDTAVSSILAPSHNTVDFTQGRRVTNGALAQANSVEVAAIFRNQARNERWFPSRDKAETVATSCKAGKTRIHKPQFGTRRI